MELRPYQVTALQAILDAEKRGVKRQLVIMATGLGKTVLIGGLLKEKNLPKTFGFMHREELLAQSKDKILALNPDANVAIEKAEEKADLHRDQIVLASVQTVGRKDRKRLSEFPNDWPEMIWIDEAHHAPSDSYLQVLDHFGVYGEKPPRNALVVGTTATPDRFDQLGYSKIFDDVVYRYGLRDAIRDKWLADIHAYRILSDLSLAGVNTRDGDFVQADLVDAILRSEMDKIAVETWRARCRDRRNLFFCVNQEHARDVEQLLKDAGAKVGLIVDSTKPQERKAMIDLFKTGEVDVLINVQVLTEGFDSPEIECIHVLRPTKSKALYTQIIGRGTRKTETKNFVDIFDYTKQLHDICSVGQIFGLPDSWDLEGQSVSEDADMVDKATAELGLKIDGIRNIRGLMNQLCQRRVQMLMGTLTDLELPSAFAWMRPSKQHERWVIAWKNETRDQAWRLPDGVRFEIEENLERYKLWGVTEQIEIFRNELGLFEARWTGTYPDGRTKTGRMDSDQSQVKLVQRIEGMINAKRFHKVKLLVKDALWRKQPVSEFQRKALIKIGVPEWLVPKLSRGDASNLFNIPEQTIRKLFDGMLEPKESEDN